MGMSGFKQTLTRLSASARIVRVVLHLMILVGLSACGNVPVSYAPDDPVESVPHAWRGEVYVSGDKSDLLSLVTNTKLEPWLERALLKNPRLQRSMMELAEVEWITRQVGADRLPSVTFTGDAAREHQGGSSGTTGNQYGLALATSWELDVWGRLANSHEAAKLDETALAADVVYAQRSLAASFIKNWLAWVNALQLLAVEQARFNTLNLNETVVRDRYLSGIGSLQDLETARTDAQEATARVAAQSQLVVATKLNLEQLLGGLGTVDDMPEQWPQVEFPNIELPAKSIGRRPDLIAAFNRVQAADKRSQVAYKNLLPGFKVNLDFTQSNISSSVLLSTDPGWLLLGQLIQPLFQGGRLRAELKAAEKRAGQAYWEYRETLLAALIEVEESLNQEFSLEQQYDSLSRAYQHAQTSQKQFEQRYRQGLANIQDLLSVQQTTFDVQSRLLTVALIRASNRIDLGLALGLPIKNTDALWP